MARKGRHHTRHQGDEDRDPHHERDDHHKHDDHEDEPGNGGDGGEEDGGDDDGDSPARQAAIIALRWVGSVPPTTELYDRARQQWLMLPGATVRAAAEVQLPAQPPTAAPNLDDGEDEL
jgi:hypothetical protein